MIQLDTIVLDKDMDWTDRHQYIHSTGVEDRTIEGGVVYQQYPLFYGNSITLVGSENHGWQTRATVELLQALADSRKKFDFIYNTLPAISVVFRYSQGALRFSPVTLVDDPNTAFWYSGTIWLMEAAP